ncbi:hypothetical protein [Acrocarpospora sp. B8E8]|uniref:hypothetical protein n=1 Tax=Acrocarpospora sp. B8E8 TaxID=3153572 RepID=UPI00325FBBDF
MSSVRGDRLNWVPAAMAVLLCSLLLVAGCRSEYFPRTVKADPGAVRELRDVGTVLEETRFEIAWDGLTTVSEVLIVDAGSSDTPEALGKAVEVLRKSGWEVTTDRLPEWVELTSAKWGNASVSMQGIDDYQYDELFDPQVGTAIKDARARAGTGALMVLEAYPSDE